MEMMLHKTQKIRKQDLRFVGVKIIKELPTKDNDDERKTIRTLQLRILWLLIIII